MKLRSACHGLLALTLLLSCKSGGGGVAGVLVVSSVDVQPGITSVILGQTLQLAATPKTSSGIAVPGRSVVWSSTDPQIATVSGGGLVNGVALGGPVRIRATVDGVVGDALVTVRAVPVDRVTVTPPNSGVLVGAGVQLAATAFDAAGATLSGRSFLWESSAPAIAAVTTTGIVIGLAQGGPVTISAISEGKTGTALVSVSTRPATRLAFVQQPGPALAGAALTPPIQIALQDDLLTTVVGAANPVMISLAGNPTGATLGGTTTKNGVSGLATFTDLTLNRPGTGYTFLVTSPGLAAATSTPFNVVVGAASRLAFTTPVPPSAQSGVAFGPQPVLQLQDAVGNSVPQSGVVITATLGSGSGSLGGTTTATTNSSGTATFSTLFLTGPAGDYTVSFSAPGIPALVSGTVTLGAGVARSLAMAIQPTSSAQSGVPLSQQPAIQLKDAAGNNAAQSGVVITAAIASGGGSLGGATTATTNSSGLAQFATLAINGAAGTYTLGFSAPGGITGVTSSPIVLGAGAPTQLGMVTQPSATATSGVAFAQQPGVRLRDGGGNPVALAGVQVTATITSGTGTLLGTATASTIATGIATFTDLAISGTVGPYTLTFSSSGLTSVISATITLGAGAAANLGLTTQPSAAGASGVAFAQQPVVQIRDAAGNAVAQSGVVITAAIATGPGGATLGGTTTATTSGSGAATFTNLAISGPSGTYTLRFTATGLTQVVSNGVTLGAGAATQLVITIQPSVGAQSGAAFAQQPAIQLRDAANNPVAQANVVVTAVIASGGGTLGGTATATTNASGLAIFSDLSITGLTGPRTLGFSSPGLTGATSGTITLSAGAATQLSITTQPSNLAQSGVVFPTQPVVQLRDGAGNAVSQVGINVTVAIASGGGTLGGTATVPTNASGIAGFAGLSISGTAGDRTLSFATAGLAGATSSVVTVTAGAASQLAITTQPSTSVQSGVGFAQQPVVELRDASNNPVSQAGVIVTAAISSGGGTLGGTTTAPTNSSGVATFTDLSISGTIGGRTLIFSAPSYTSITSGTVTVTAGAATQLVITTPPSSLAQSGVTFGQQPVIELRDASGNTVGQAGVMVTAAIAGGGGTLGGTTTVPTNGSGVATFSNLSIAGTIGIRTLDFSAPTLTGATSGNITLSAGPANKLIITTQPPGTAQSGVAFAPQPVIQVRDASDNPVTQAGIGVTASIASGPAGTLGGSTTVTTDANGDAAFVNLSLSGSAGSYSLGFGSGALTPAASTSIILSAGAGSTLSITTQPSASAQSGVAFGQQPVIQLRDGANNPVAQANVLITATIQTGGGTLGGTTNATTDGSGVATFTDLSITGTVGNRTLLFAAAGFVGVASNAISITAGTASQLTITTQPSASALNGTAFAQQPVIQVSDASGNPVSQPGVTVTAVIASGGGTLGGTTTAPTDAGGVATFVDLFITGSPGDRTLGFSAPSLTGATSGTISVTAGAPTQVTITTQPSASAQSGSAFAQQPVLQLRDAASNPVSQAGVMVTAVIASGGGALGGTTAVPTDPSGVATFTDLSISGTPGDRTLGFSAPSLTGAASGTINITAASATQLTITTQPSATAQSGIALAQQPVIQLADAGSSPVSQAGVVVTAAIASGAGTLSGTTIATTDGNGTATFTDLVITGSTGNRTLGFSTPGLTGATSSSINITAGVPDTIRYFTQPSTNATNGVAFSTQPVLLVRDASGNNVDGEVVTATITAGSPAGASLIGGVTATTAPNGRASFSGLGLTGPAGSYTLTFTTNGGALSSPESNSITLIPGAAAIITANSLPSQSATVGTAVGAPPSVRVTDTGGNPIASVNVTFTEAGGGTLVPASPATVPTDGSGVATLTSWTLGSTAGTNNYAVQAAASGLAGSPISFTASGTAGPATQLTITTEPSSTANNNVPFPQQPVLLLRDGFNNPVSSTSVTATITGSPAGVSLIGTVTVSTDAFGVATFSGLGLTGILGTYSLTFTANALTVTSVNILLLP